MLKRSPFQSKKSQKMEYETIGSEATGVIYLLKRGGISPSENPQDVQEMIQRQAEATLIFLQGVRQLAERDGITTEQARERIFPTKTADGEGEVAVADEVDLYDVLDPSQAKNLILNQENAREVAIRAATLFIQNRLLYPIILTSEAKPKSTALSVEPLRFGVAIGNRFKFGNETIESKDEADFDSETIEVSAIPQTFEAGAVGFLLDATGREKVGDDQWTDEMTRKYLMEEQITLIYQFYQAEIGVKAEVDEETEGNLISKTKSLSSSNTSTESQSTGMKSTGESKAMGFGTSASAVKTLESNPIGL